ncbi:MAG TPA: FkbM family methyltransferase, partial [Chryseolinea sp.]|nr:FkbM family methyltransferase [Chryseolinea sp.]
FKILSGSYSYPKITLLFSYIRLVSKSISYHKLPSQKRLRKEVMNERILDFTIQFYSYPELIYLFEEIFIQQVYKFQCNTSNPFIIDCGSNIGMSIFYFKKIFPNATILAFEPELKTFKILKENVERNNLENISLLNYALSDFEGSASLFVRNLPNASLNTGLISSDVDSHREEVQTKRLSGYIQEMVTMLKIDVEGSEAQILKDIIEHKKTDLIQQMIIEFHPNVLPESVQYYSQLLKQKHLFCAESGENPGIISKDVIRHFFNNRLLK